MKELLVNLKAKKNPEHFDHLTMAEVVIRLRNIKKNMEIPIGLALSGLFRTSLHSFHGKMEENRAYFFIIILLSLFLTTQVKAQNNPLAELFPATGSNNAPGVVVLLAKEGQIITSYADGIADCDTIMPITSQTQFWIASLTKQFTAYGIYLLEKQGRLNRKDLINRYLPELPSIADGITVSHLLKHRSGLRDGFVLAGLSFIPEHGYTNENVYRLMCQQESLNFLPGTKYQYNNSGYVLLAMIIERITGVSYPEFIKQNVFEPLQMKNSFIASNFNTASPEMAKGYRKEGNSYVPYFFTGDSYGSTGMVSTAQDLVLWAQHFSGQVSKKGYWNSVSSTDFYDMGMERHTIAGETIFSHFGSDPGYKAQLIICPKSDMILVGLTNYEQCYGLYDGLYKYFENNLKHITKTTEGSSSIKITPGYYLNLDEHYFIAVEEDSISQNLRVSTTYGGYKQVYYPTKKGFTNAKSLPTLLDLAPGALIVRNKETNENIKMQRIQLIEEKNISDHLGTYHSHELNTDYTIVAENGSLALTAGNGLSIPFTPLGNGVYIANIYGNTFLEFNGVNMSITMDGVTNLVCEKK